MRIKWRYKNKRDGYLVPDDDVARDRETVRVPMLLFDAATGGRRPGYATLSDQAIADRQAARMEFIDRAEQAWRGVTNADARRKKRNDDEGDPNGDEDDEPDFGASVEKDAGDVRARSIAARDAYVASLREAYRRPGGRDVVFGRD
jgi:hypothetical protein